MYTVTDVDGNPPVKSPLSVMLKCANAPSRFWPDATVDFTCKKNTLWAKRDEHGDLSTANNRMQPAFAGSYKTVAIPFGSRVTGYVPREHPLVENGSFELALSKASIFLPITTRRVFACSISPQDLSSLSRISNHTPMNFLFEIHHRAYYGAPQSF